MLPLEILRNALTQILHQTAQPAVFPTATAARVHAAGAGIPAAISECTDIVIHSSKLDRIELLTCSDAYTENGTTAPLFADPNRQAVPKLQEITAFYY